MFDFLFALIGCFRYLLQFRRYERNVYSFAVFTGVDLFCTQLLFGPGRPPSTILGNRNLEALGYPVVKTASFGVPSF